MGELGVQYQSDWLLDRYCRDTTAGLDHASGEVYASLKTFYTVSELEALHLWDNLAAKTTATNYCASASAQAQPPPVRPTVRVERPLPTRPTKS